MMSLIFSKILQREQKLCKRTRYKNPFKVQTLWKDFFDRYFVSDDSATAAGFA